MEEKKKMRKEKLEELKDLINELKTIKVDKRTNGNKFLHSEAYNFTLNNGVVIPRERLIKGKNDGSAAIIMPILTNDEVLIVVEPRVFTELMVGVGFPAGYIESEKKEAPIVAAKRELVEETGYIPGNIWEIDSFYQDEGCSKALNHLFMATSCEKKYDQKLDSDEVVRYMTVNYSELFELEKMGYIKGSNSKLLLEKSKVYMKRRR